MKECKICRKLITTSKNIFCSRECYAKYLATDKDRLLHCSNIATLGGQSRWKEHEYSYHANGYIMIKSLEHPYKNKRGYVYAHRLKKEKEIGRNLFPSEVVHHRDGNKLNNNIDNLEIFKTTNEHTRFHGLKGDLR